MKNPIHHFHIGGMLTLNWPIKGYIDIRITPFKWRQPFYSCWGFIGYKHYWYSYQHGNRFYHIGPLMIVIGDTRGAK